MDGRALSMSLISSLRTLKRCSWPVRLAQTGVVLAAAGGLSACVTLDVPEDAFFWPDDRVAAEQLILPADPPPGDAEVVVLRYAAGGIGATRVRAGAANTPLILYCGGNTFRRSAGGGAAARKLSPLGDVLMFDYPGYGDTVGTADIAHFRAVTEVMARQARALADAESRPLIAWGHSLGGSVCAEAAQGARADVLVLETTTPSAWAMIHSHLGLMRLFVRPLIAPALASMEIPSSLAGYRGRVLVLEAGRDEMLAPGLSRMLEEGLSARGVDVERLVFPNARHADMGEQADFASRIAAAILVRAADAPAARSRAPVRHGSEAPPTPAHWPMPVASPT